MDRIYTGFESFDKHLKICKGDLVVIGGNPAIGKTCLMCSMIEKTMAKQKILFFTMQTNKHKAIDRISVSSCDNSTLWIYESIDNIEKLLYKIMEHKDNLGVDVVYIDNFEDFLIYSNCYEKELVLKLLDLAKKLKISIIVSDVTYWVDRKRSIYRHLRHKEFIKYADKIITINRPDRTATEKEIRDGLVEQGVAEIRIDKDLEEYFSPWINLKFDNNSLTFNEIPKTP